MLNPQLNKSESEFSNVIRINLKKCKTVATSILTHVSVSVIINKQIK